MFTSFLRRGLLTGGLILSVMSTVASADTFTVNPGAVGVAAPTVQANFTDFSYVARVNQTATNAQARSMSRAPNSLAHTGSRVWPMSWPMPE